MCKRWIGHFRKWVLDGYDKQCYKAYRDEIEKYNINMLEFFNILVFILLAIVLISGFFTQYVEGMRNVYISMSVFTAAEMLLDRFVLFKDYKFMDVAIFLCMAKIYVFCIISGVNYSLDMPAISFSVFMIVLSILFIVRPWKLNLFNFFAGIIFCIYSYIEKIPEIALADIFNWGVFFVVALAVSFWIVKLRLGFIKNEKLLIIQRDTDIMTTLPNRRRFNIYAQEAFGNGENQRLSFLMMDVDHFKAYNDTKGHIAGDYCLECIGKALVKFGEEQGLFFARYGGEEFVAVDTRRSKEELEKIAEGIVDTIYKLGLPHESSAFKRITISVGYAIQEDAKAEDYVQLLECADKALYQAKQQGRNKIAGFMS